MPRTKTTQRPRRQPQLRLHKRSQRTYVTLSGQTFWCGAADDPARFATFAQHVQAWEERDRQPLEHDEDAGDALLVGDLVERYEAHVRRQKGDGWLVAGGNGARPYHALETLRIAAGTTPVARFGPKALQAVRLGMIRGSLWEEQRTCCRNEANARTRVMQRMFRWAAGQELVDAAAAMALQSVEPLDVGDYGARENPPREAVEAHVVDATLSYLPQPLRTVVQLLQLTGARPSEVLQLRPIDIDVSDSEQWVAVLKQHKTAKRRKARVLVFEKEAQELLRPFMRRSALLPLFRPADYEKTAHSGRRKGHVPSRNAARYRETYDACALGRAVTRAVQRANRDRADEELPALPHWSPYQLRHSGATAAALLIGGDAATALLGHSSAATTRVYVHAEVERAKQASKRVREARGAAG